VITEPKVVSLLTGHQTILGLALLHEVGLLRWLPIHRVDLRNAKRVKQIAVVLAVPEVGEPVLCVLTWVQDLFGLVLGRLGFRLGLLLVLVFAGGVVELTICQDGVGWHWDFNSARCLVTRVNIGGNRRLLASLTDDVLAHA